MRAAAAGAKGALASVAAAVGAAADVRVCAVDGGEVADIVGEGLEAVGVDPFSHRSTSRECSRSGGGVAGRMREGGRVYFRT